MAIPQKFVEREYMTEDEYFEFEASAFGRWEYVDGEIRAMSGGSDDHNTIAGNTGSILRNALAPRGCRVYNADMKVHTGDGVNTFPDIAVVCGPREYHRGRTDIINNPILIIEVLSESTQAYDRGEKFDHFRTIPTLVDYLLLQQDEPRAMLYTRRDDSWNFKVVTGPESHIELPSVGVTLALADVYALIEFNTEQRLA